MSDSTRYLGISQPISTAQPDEIDLRLSDDLKKCLGDNNLYENEEELQKRIDVLCRVTSTVKEFIRIISKQKLPPNEGEEHECGGKLFTFGSYRLGVHNRGADIDTLLVAPRHVDRKDFFTVFYDMLNNDPDVTELHRVEDAFVPVIKLQYCGIELDILFARLALKVIPDDQSLQDDNLLKNLDDKSIRSLNGSRVAHEILNSIPSQVTFVVVLRAIKFWAKQHGVYSNVLGYFGGITWAILTARICQLYPNAAPSKLIQKFFYVFKQWQWPSPVFLKDTNSNRPDFSSSLQEMVWDPRIRLSDRMHLMPVVTPAFPEQNSTYNVTNSTKKILCSELEEAAILTDEIYQGKSTWDKLFEPVNFFTKYKHFVGVLCAAKDATDHLNYVGFIESRLRLLTAGLERHEAVLNVQTNTKQFKPITMDVFQIGYDNPVTSLWFAGLDLDASLAKTLDLTTEIAAFMKTVSQQQALSPERYNEFMKIEVKYVSQRDIKLYLKRDDFLYGRRYVKRKPVLSRQSSNSEKPTTPIALKSSLDPGNGPVPISPTAMDTSLSLEVSNTEVKAEPPTNELVVDGNDNQEKPVFSFGKAETAAFPENEGQKPMETEQPIKPVVVLQETFNSLPKIEISSDDDLKNCVQTGIKRAIGDGTEEEPAEKQSRQPDVTVP